MIWNTNLNEAVTEELYGIQATRIDTDIYITDKPEIKRLPQDIPKPTKKEAKAMASAQKMTPKPEVKPDPV